MFDGIDATGWLVIVCALALGFGLARFLLVAWQDQQHRADAAAAGPPSASDAGRPDAPDA